MTVADSPSSPPRSPPTSRSSGSTRDVSRTGRPEPARLQVGGHPARAWFTPGHGEDLSHRIAAAIGRASRRVRIASPGDHGRAGDRHARRGGGRGARGPARRGGPHADERGLPSSGAGTRARRWKVPIVAVDPRARRVRGKPSTPYTPESAPRLHAREGHGGRRRGVRRLVQPLALGRDERRERARAARPRAGRAAGRVHRRDPRPLRADVPACLAVLRLLHRPQHLLRVVGDHEQVHVLRGDLALAQHPLARSSPTSPSQ